VRGALEAAVAERAEAVDDREGGEDGPEEEAEGDGGLCAAADGVEAARDLRAVADGEGMEPANQKSAVRALRPKETILWKMRLATSGMTPT